jgi:hypothetical protein
MTTKFNMTRDINGYNGFGLQFTDTAYSCTLATSTDTTLTVPAAVGIGGPEIYQGTGKPYTLAVFSYDPGTAVWVADGHMASAPGGDTFAATNSELNPAARLVQGGDILHFFSTGTDVDVSVTFYSLA